MDFYSMRNKRIINLIHGGYLDKKNTVFSPYINIIKNLLTLRYKKATMETIGFSELLRGPGRLMEVYRTAWEYHGFLGKSLSLEIVDSNESPPIQESFSLFTKFLTIVSLNGHLIPKSFFKKIDKPFILNINHTRLFDAFRIPTLVYRDEFTNQGYVVRHDKKIFFILFFRSFGLLLKGIVFLPKIQDWYKNSFSFMTSEVYWREVLSVKSRKKIKEKNILS